MSIYDVMKEEQELEKQSMIDALPEIDDQEIGESELQSMAIMSDDISDLSFEELEQATSK